MPKLTGVIVTLVAVLLLTVAPQAQAQPSAPVSTTYSQDGGWGWCNWWNWWYCHSYWDGGWGHGGDWGHGDDWGHGHGHGW